ncbi:glycosyl hydrolase family 71-domain-containing protein [Aspergillus fruticulosus]
MRLSTFLSILDALSQLIHATPSAILNQASLFSDRLADYDNDMRRAKSLGIDAFALNIGDNPYTDQQLSLAYQAAANNDMKVFISFDFNWCTQLKFDGKVFVSSFAGDGLDIAAMYKAAGQEIYLAPNYHPEYGTDLDDVDGLLNWMAWSNDGNNKAPRPSASVSVADGDEMYIWTGKDYIAHSHYIGPLSSLHTDDGAYKWINDMPHDGWMDMSKPFITAYKDRATSVDSYITEDLLVYWYRPTPRDVNCDATDNYSLNSRPNGWETIEDVVFVVTLLTEPATVAVNSGGNVEAFDAPVGPSTFKVPMGVGSQAFLLSRNRQIIQSNISLLPIIDSCICGLYNFNAYMGSLPPSPIDSLQSAGLKRLTQGLNVRTCSPAPSLGKVVPKPPPGWGVAPSTTRTTGTTTRTTRTSTHTTTIRATTSSIRTSTTTRPTSSTRTGMTTRTSTARTITTTNPTGGTGDTCIARRGRRNYAGLCSFACNPA